MAPVLAASAARALSNLAVTSPSARAAGSVALAAGPGPEHTVDDGPRVEHGPRNDDILPAKTKSFFRFRR